MGVEAPWSIHVSVILIIPTRCRSFEADVSQKSFRGPSLPHIFLSSPNTVLSGTHETYFITGTQWLVVVEDTCLPAETLMALVQRAHRDRGESVQVGSSW